ncbi:hypothetical protein CPB97_006522, partial [Podila verticillata]
DENENKVDECKGDCQSESMEESRDEKESVPRKMAHCRGPRAINRDQKSDEKNENKAAENENKADEDENKVDENENKADEREVERQSESMEKSRDGKEGVPGKMAHCRGPRAINGDQRFLSSSSKPQFQSTLWIGASFNFGSPGSGAATTTSSLGVNLNAENPPAMPAFTFSLGAPTVSSMVKKVGENTF